MTARSSMMDIHTLLEVYESVLRQNSGSKLKTVMLCLIVHNAQPGTAFVVLHGLGTTGLSVFISAKASVATHTNGWFVWIFSRVQVYTQDVVEVLETGLPDSHLLQDLQIDFATDGFL